ncbi:hypothetical protein PHMEG_00017696 [Phytophthora megakarya]|uniref:Uncharacterized protein n=1 Tax=Phytophthora megakarya TaxID=4795 RepID=A0A225VX85_9STRA|nr:hypothetical protein PHMEG_00017696 [Phytophthora megakarya]
MSLSAFIPANTQKARATGVSTFERILKTENVSLDFGQACILSDRSSKTLEAVMDRFGYYLAIHEGKKGKFARNTAISYFRNGDIHSLIRYVYSTASVASDYEDATLACIMWHCFGRPSDLGYVSKQHITISADNVFHILMLRVKTTEEQGLTLVPDRDDFLTCPLYALPVALVMQEAPCVSLLSQLPFLAAPGTTSLNAGEPLLEMLEAARSKTTLAASSLVTKSTTSPSPSLTSTALAAPVPRSPSPYAARLQKTSQARGEDGVQAYVNRFLKRVAKPAGATGNLTWHSFLRGGAQHANGDELLAAQWIFDLGSWDMTLTNKGFAYVFNTPREDRKVARVLSDWKADEAPTVADVAVLDHGAQERLLRLQDLLFGCCV